MNHSTPSTAQRPAVFNVPPGRPFLDCLARAILTGNLLRPGGPVPDMLDLPNWTILLPTRRAARAFQEAFLRASSGRAMLMPRVRPIAEAQEDLSLLSGLASLDTLGAGHADGADASDVPMAISEIERRLVLTRLVMQWSDVMRKGAEQAAAAQADGDLLPVASAGAGTPAQAAAGRKAIPRTPTNQTQWPKRCARLRCTAPFPKGRSPCPSSREKSPSMNASPARFRRTALRR